VKEKMASEEMMAQTSPDAELVELKVKKKYLELFKEICDENGLDADEELHARLEEALVDSFSAYSSRCLREERALKFLKGGKGCKRIPGFNFDQVEKLLSKMDTLDEKIDWLNNYLKQLQQTKQTMYSTTRGIPISTVSSEEQYTGLTPYIQTYPLAIKEVQKKIRELEAQKIVETNVVHKM
jgi:hypothetical protein